MALMTFKVTRLIPYYIFSDIYLFLI